MNIKDQNITKEESIRKNLTDNILFKGRFIRSVLTIEDLPDYDKCEFTFVGRSNVGKSSLLNSIFGVHGMARVSNTPGRTQMLNFFDVEVNNKKPFYLVDIPGFGYSKAPKKQVDNWVRLIKDYLMGRPSLLRVFFLIDSRHGLKENDHEMMALLNKAAVSYQIILTKIDKISRSSCDETFEKVAKESKQYVACHPQILKTSSEKKIGILEIKKEIFELLLDKLA